MKTTFIIISFIFVSSITFSQETSYNREDYFKILSETNRVNLFNINNHRIDVTSDCGANFDEANKTLYTTKDCRGRFWMENIPSLETAYEFILDFSLSSDFVNSGKTYPLQVMLSNSPNGFSWLGVNKNGTLEISYRDAEGFTDVLQIIKADKVHFDRENHLRFVQFPDGIFYVELNSYERLSYDLGDKSIKKIPIVGLSNRINFYSNVIIEKLELNAIQEKPAQDDFITEMENISANMQASQLLGIETDEKRMEYRNSMKIMFDNPCFGNCENGYGIYDYNDGVQYMGEWKDGKFEGKGIMYNDGTLYYKGSFENGVMHGYAEVYKNGDLIFKGQFKNGEPVLD